MCWCTSNSRRRSREAEAPFRTLVDDSRWGHASIEGLLLDLGRWWEADFNSRLVQQINFSVAASEAVRTANGVYVEGYIWVDDQVMRESRRTGDQITRLDGCTIRWHRKQENDNEGYLISIHEHASAEPARRVLSDGGLERLDGVRKA